MKLGSQGNGSPNTQTRKSPWDEAAEKLHRSLSPRQVARQQCVKETPNRPNSETPNRAWDEAVEQLRLRQARYKAPGPAVTQQHIDAGVRAVECSIASPQANVSSDFSKSTENSLKTICNAVTKEVGVRPVECSIANPQANMSSDFSKSPEDSLKTISNAVTKEVRVRPVECSIANPQANMSSDFSKSTEDSLKIISNVVSKEVSRESMISCDRSPIHKSSTPLPSNNIQLPFLKNSAMWQMIESMEIFKKMPQQPHFQPLEKDAMEFREGLAIGLMISFANLVSSVQQLQVVDPETTIKEKFELLLRLEENGFDVQFLRSRLEKLLELQACRRQFESTKSSLNATIIEKDKDNGRIDAVMTNLDNTISEMKQKLKQARDERMSLNMKKCKCETEIRIMEMDLRDAEKAYNSAVNSSTASLAALL